MKIVCLLLLTPLLQAQTVDQVRLRLKTLAGKAPLTLLAERQDWSRELKRDAVPETRWVKARVETSTTGPRVVAGTESGSLPEKPGEAPGALRAGEVVQILEAAEELAKTLAEARLESEQTEMRNNRPTKHFRFNLPLEDEAEARKHLKEAWRTLDLWVDSDGTPLGALEAFKIKGRVMFVSIEAGAKIRREYRTLGDRLVLVLEEKDARGSGLGQGSEGRTVLTATPL